MRTIIRTALIGFALAQWQAPAPAQDYPNRPITLVLPLYVIFTQIHLLNTRAALIVSYTTFALPFGIWMMIGFLKELPIDLEEAAAVDGCNRWQILQKVVIPLAAPGIATTAIFAFLLGWNEFLFSLILAGPDSRTLPVLIASFDSDRGKSGQPQTG